MRRGVRRERSLKRASCAEAVLLWPYFWTMSLRLTISGGHRRTPYMTRGCGRGCHSHGTCWACHVLRDCHGGGSHVHRVIHVQPRQTQRWGGRPARGSDGKPRELFLHITGKVDNDGHDFVRGQEAVSVEGVDDALFGLAERAVARYTTQHEESQVLSQQSSYMFRCSHPKFAAGSGGTR
jgi:hypothetical protein